MHFSVGRFGRLTNGNYEIEELTGDTFFYESQTLMCGSDGSPVVWRYSQNSDLSNPEILQESYNYVDFSWLEVDNTRQGYYQCQIGNGIRYIIGLYDQTITTGQSLLIVKEMYNNMYIILWFTLLYFIPSSRCIRIDLQLYSWNRQSRCFTSL